MDSLFRAIAQADGRVVIVTGAGCSVEDPTSLPAAERLSEDCHRQLLADGSIESEAPNPRDIADLAEFVYRDHESHEKLVARFPFDRMVRAAPNDGHMIAAAMMAEGAIASILTLNFDHAHDNAITELNSPESVGVIRGESDASAVGSRNLVYLHGKLDYTPANELVLRPSQLASEWRNTWREQMAQRVLATGHVIMVGLGDPATRLLIDTAQNIQRCMDGKNELHVADVIELDRHRLFPELNLDQDRYHKLGWCDLMKALAGRLMSEQVNAIALASKSRLEDDDIPEIEDDSLHQVLEQLEDLGLVSFGYLRAKWFQDRSHKYRPFNGEAGRIADLVLLLALLTESASARLELSDDGVADLFSGENRLCRLVLASGAGERGWSQVCRRAISDAERLSLGNATSVVVVVAGTGAPPAIDFPESDLLAPAGAEYTGLDTLHSADLTAPPVIRLMLHADEVRKKSSALMDHLGASDGE